METSKEFRMKTTNYYVIWMATGYGFNGYEVIDFFEDYKEAKRCIHEYRMNGGTYVMRSRKIKEDKNVFDCRFIG